MKLLGGAQQRWLMTAAGAVAGGVVGAIVAANVVIYAGPDSGYETDIGDLFRHSSAVGVITVALVVLGPVVGGLAMWRFLRRPPPS